jgi:RHS repeat-associated protein
MSCGDSPLPDSSGHPSQFEGIRYFHPDHLGSVSYITDREGNRVAEYVYDPYGKLLTDFSSGTDISKYKYTAQQADSDTGLYYYKARYYDSDMGRFISADSIVPDPGRSQAYNRYMYVEGNPVRYTDPSGNMPLIFQDVDTSSKSNRNRDVEFNWGFNNNEGAVTGIEGSDNWLYGEKGFTTTVCDRVFLHPTAVVHDWFVSNVLDKYLNGNNIGVQILYWSLFVMSMPFCFGYGTAFAIMNYTIQFLNNTYDFLLYCLKMDYEILKQINRFYQGLCQDAQDITFTFTGLIQNFNPAIKNTIKASFMVFQPILKPINRVVVKIIKFLK